MNIEKDFIEFFGCPRTEVLNCLNGITDVNVIKRKLFPTYTTLKNLYKIIKNTEYFTIWSNHISDNWFKIIEGDTHLRKSLPITMFDDVLNNFIKKSKSTGDNWLKSYRNLKILDYGCGSGKHGLFFALHGYDVTLADIPHKHFEFLKFLCKKYNIKIKFYNVPCSNTFSFPEKYDYIINSEVMEHCDEPVQVLESITKSLKPDGIMYLSTFFNDMNGLDPSHLRKNTERYEDSKKWFIEVDKLGLYCYRKDQNGVEKGYKLKKG